MPPDTPHVDPSLATCPVPPSEYATVQLAHGGGGRMTARLLEELFLKAFDNPALAEGHDGALLEVGTTRLAFSTDSYVVRPLFFPGGNIGSLAVHGTVNDLSMCGARPLALAAGFILEEGFSMEALSSITLSMQQAAVAAGVAIVTGDTKVVDRGKGDGVYINTSGIGLVPSGIRISPGRARPGDRVLVNGTLADHGIAILSVREGLEFETRVETDSAPLNGLVEAMLQAAASARELVPDTSAGGPIHVLRDPTRGGVASALNEIARSAGVGIRLEEAALPLREEVRGACEILGFDPLYVANEGKCLALVAPQVAEEVLATMRRHPLGRQAALIGEVTAEHPGRVVLRNPMGSTRVVDLLSGEQLPRIC